MHTLASLRGRSPLRRRDRGFERVGSFKARRDVRDLDALVRVDARYRSQHGSTASTKVFVTTS
jgi:hypothetical protein